MSYDPQYQVSGISGGLPPLPKPSDLIHRSDVEKLLNQTIALISSDRKRVLPDIAYDGMKSILEGFHHEISSIQSVDVQKEIDKMIEEYKMNGAYNEPSVHFIEIVLQELKQRLAK